MVCCVRWWKIKNIYFTHLITTLYMMKDYNFIKMGKNPYTYCSKTRINNANGFTIYHYFKSLIIYIYHQYNKLECAFLEINYFLNISWTNTYAKMFDWFAIQIQCFETRRKKPLTCLSLCVRLSLEYLWQEHWYFLWGGDRYFWVCCVGCRSFGYNIGYSESSCYYKGYWYHENLIDISIWHMFFLILVIFVLQW